MESLGAESFFSAINTAHRIVFRRHSVVVSLFHGKSQEVNERLIWEYMIDNEYLFSSSSNLIERFVDLAPFSKFGLDIDRDSPGSVGVWLGLQILNSYEKNNNVSLVEILSETDYMKILNKSGYKP